jgi:hypothetical protein
MEIDATLLFLLEMKRGAFTAEESLFTAHSDATSKQITKRIILTRWRNKSQRKYL